MRILEGKPGIVRDDDYKEKEYQKILERNQSTSRKNKSKV